MRLLVALIWLGTLFSPGGQDPKDPSPETTARSLELPREFPIPMVFRPMEGRHRKDPLNLLAPFPIVHAGPTNEVEKRWPEKMTILHRGWASAGRRGDKLSRKIWPGHFLYWTGSKVTEDVEPQATRIRVEHPEHFRTENSERVASPDDIALYALTAEGKPDWSRVEHAALTGVGDGFIEVRRGLYGSSPLAFRGGRAVAASHAQYCGDAFGVQAWSLNFSLECPRSPEGLNAAEFLARHYAEELKNDYPLADGIELDVGTWRHWIYNRAVDCDNDLRPDWGFQGGVNSFGLGGQLCVRELRRLLGPDRIIQVDSGNAAQGFRGWNYVNGIEIEYFPAVDELDHFSPAFEHLRHWVEKAAARPAFTYGLTKAATTVFGGRFELDGRATNYRFRLGFAASLILGMPHAYAAEGAGQAVKGGETTDTFSVFPWDEYRGGDLNRGSWLGRPKGPAVRSLDDLNPQDLLPEGGTPWVLRVTPGYKADEDERRRGTYRVTSIPARPSELGVCLESPPLPLEPGREYTLDFEASARDSWSHAGQTFENVPTLLTLGFSTGRDKMGVLADRNPRRYTITFVAPPTPSPSARLRLGFGEQATEVSIRGFRLRQGGAERWSREFEHGKVLLNATKSPWTVKVGSGYRHLKGDQDPEVNSGRPAGEKIVVPPRDARLLYREGS